MSDYEYDDDDIPELTAASPTLSATSDYDLDEDDDGVKSDNLNEDSSVKDNEEDVKMPQEDTILVSTSSSSSAGTGNSPKVTGNIQPSDSDIYGHSNPNIGYFNASFIPIELNIEPPASNLDNISQHMERVSLYAFSNPISCTSKVFRPASPMKGLNERNLNAHGRPSATIRPNIHAPIMNPGNPIAGVSGTNVGFKKSKRVRTAFNTQQLMELEKEYSKSKYINRTARLSLARELALNERTVKVWFQNRRMKDKKEKADEEEVREPIEAADNTERYQVPSVNQGSIYQYYPPTQTFAPNSTQGNLMIPSYPLYMPYLPPTYTPMMQYQQMPSPQTFQVPPGYQPQQLGNQQQPNPHEHQEPKL